MAYSHRQNDARVCGDLTKVIGQDFVSIEGQLWAVQNDIVFPGGGALTPSKTYVKINGKPIIVVGDTAAPDVNCDEGGPHCAPNAVGYSSLVNVQ